MKALLSLILFVGSSIPRNVFGDTRLSPDAILSEQMGARKVMSGGGFGWSRGVKGDNWRQAGAITLDPVSIISLLALAAFLINNILQLLKTNQLMHNSGRSLEVADLDLPLELSDMATGRRNLEEDSKRFTMRNLLGNLGSVYFVSSKKRSACITKILVCSQDEVSNSIRKTFGGPQSILFDLLLSIVTKMVTPELMRATVSRPCQSLDEICSDGILREAEAVTHNQIYSLLSTYAVQKFISR